MGIFDNVLITGGNGAVGSYIDFGVRLGRESLDVRSYPECLQAFERHRPAAVIHLAALTDLEKCESEPQGAYEINAAGTYHVALAARMTGAKMIYVSTDAVFSHASKPHSIEDEPGPQGAYARSKHLGELAVRGLSSEHIIARTSWVFGGGPSRDKKFVGKFIQALEKGEAKAVDDQFGSPTYAKDLVSALKKLISEGKRGTFHLANSGTATRYDMARTIAETLSSTASVNPVSGAAFGLKPYQLASGGLAETSIEHAWQDALKEYLITEWKAQC